MKKEKNTKPSESTLQEPQTTEVKTHELQLSSENKQSETTPTETELAEPSPIKTELAETKPTEVIPSEKAQTEETKPEIEQNQTVITPADILAQNINQWNNILEGKEHADSIGDLARHLAEELISGQLSEESIDMLRRSVRYDQDVADARRQGEIKGRNERIDEYMIERRKASEIHDLGTATHHNKPTTPRYIIGGLSAADRTSIWERGNEKRIKRG